MNKQETTRNSRFNALKHGLSVPLRKSDPTSVEEMERLVYAIAGENPTPKLLQATIEFVEGEFEIRRVENARIAAIESAAQRGTEAEASEGDSAEAIIRENAAALVRSLPAQSKLDRYEKQILAKRRRNLGRFIIAALE